MGITFVRTIVQKKEIKIVDKNRKELYRVCTLKREEGKKLGSKAKIDCYCINLRRAAKAVSDIYDHKKWMRLEINV